MNYLASGRRRARMGNAHPNIVPYQVFPVADGHVIIAVGNDGQFAQFCASLGRPELADDARFRTNAGRVRNRALLSRSLPRCICERTRDELLAALAPAGVPAGPINTSPTSSPIRRSSRAACASTCRPRRRRAEHSRAARSPTAIDGTPQVSQRPPPLLGEHTAHALRDPAWT